MRLRTPALIAGVVGTLVLTGCTTAAGPGSPASSSAAATPAEAFRGVSPAMERYDREQVDALWDRPGLSARDRSLVTVAQIIASDQSDRLEPYLERALDDGVRPAEVSETLTQLAFYAGRNVAAVAAPVVRKVFTERGVDVGELPAAELELRALTGAALAGEQQREAQVQDQFRSTAPGVTDATRDVLFRDLWLRPDLSVRDRALVTLVSQITNGQAAQSPYVLGLAIDDGLTRAQMGEVLTQLAYFTGWPDVFAAMPVVDETFQSR